MIKAKTKYVRISPRKARLVVDMIRGMEAEYAVEVLRFTNKKAALPIRKTLESAIANAKNNFDMDTSKLLVLEARVDEAPTFKRGLPVARGRYHQILKRNSHIVIGIGSEKTVTGKATADNKKEFKDDKKTEVKKESKVNKETKKGKTVTKNSTKNTAIKKTETDKKGVESTKKKKSTNKHESK